MKRVISFVVAAAVVALAACGDDASQINGTPPSATRGNGAGPDTSGNTGGGTATSNGPVASLVVTPHAAQVSMGSYVTLVALARDAAGVRVAKAATWRSSDPSIAIASDTGIVYGKAVGTAKVYATLDGFIDSTIVQVTPAPPNNGGGSGGGQTPAPVSQFNMTVVAMGAIPGTDTSHTERIAGATVTLQRTGGVSGDTLKTPEPAGFATTNANGEAKFTNLVGGTYSIRITPAAGSAYAETTTGIAPPRQSDITAFVTLRRP